MSAERLLAMFNPKAPSWTPTGRGFEALRPEDVAHALAGLDRAPYLLALMKWAGEETPSLEAELRRLLLMESIEIAVHAGWHIPRGPHYVEGLVRTAVWETLDRRACWACSGHGLVYPRGGVAMDCKHCAGTGRGNIDEAERAEMAKIPVPAWNRIWKRRYWRVAAVLDGWESEARAHLAKRLAEVEPANPCAA